MILLSFCNNWRLINNMSTENYNIETQIEELIGLWPKTRRYGQKQAEKQLLLQLKISNHNMQLLRNAIEVCVNDTALNKLPDLSKFILHVLGRVTPSMSNTTAEPVEYVKPEQTTPVAQPHDGIEKSFNNIWDQWPKNPNSVETRRIALQAFSQAVGAMTLPVVENACSAYLSAFGEGGMKYSKNLKTFLADFEEVDAWAQNYNNRIQNEKIRKYFDAAYEWYPPFHGKDKEKTRADSWVTYWRYIKPDVRLEFMLFVRAYASRGPKMGYDEDSGEMTNFTMSFANFVKEFKEYFVRKFQDKKWDSKDDELVPRKVLYETKYELIKPIFRRIVTPEILDYENIYPGMEASFMVGVPYFLSGPLRAAIIYNTHAYDACKWAFSKVVEGVQDYPGKNYKIVIRDVELAKKQVAVLDVPKLCQQIYDTLEQEIALQKPPVKIIPPAEEEVNKLLPPASSCSWLTASKQ
jgi:hypothetical protein